MYAHYKRQHCPVIYSLDKKEASTSLGGLTVKIYWLLLGHSMCRKYQVLGSDQKCPQGPPPLPILLAPIRLLKKDMYVPLCQFCQFSIRSGIGLKLFAW